MRLRNLLLTFLALAAALTLTVLSYGGRVKDVTIGFSKEGCEVLGVMKVPAAETGEEAAPCRLEHADLSLSSDLGGRMYHVEYGGFEFDISQGLVAWTEKNGVKRDR